MKVPWGLPNDLFLVLLILCPVVVSISATITAEQSVNAETENERLQPRLFASQALFACRRAESALLLIVVVFALLLLPVLVALSSE